LHRIRSLQASRTNEVEDRIKKNLKSLFRCRQVEVRPISGTVANDPVFSRYLGPGDVVMVNSTPGGGHISHHHAGSVGKYTHNIVDFPLTSDGYRMDVERTLELARAVAPKAMILGKSLFLFPEPVRELAGFCRERHIALLYDGAHVLGLIAGHEFQDPLEEGALLITASTHKTFFGSQRGVILSNAGENEWRKIDKGAFPGSSSNHHLDTLVSLAIATYEMMEFGQAYARQTIANAKALGAGLHALGFKVQAAELGFTESHQLALDVCEFGGGDEVARHLKDNNIILNMNLLPFEPLDRVTNPAGGSRRSNTPSTGPPQPGWPPTWRCRRSEEAPGTDQPQDPRSRDRGPLPRQDHGHPQPEPGELIPGLGDYGRGARAARPLHDREWGFDPGPRRQEHGPRRTRDHR